MSHVISIGGTFEKGYNRSIEGLDFSHIHTIDDTATSKLLADRRMGHTAELLMAIDSTQMTASERDRVYRASMDEPEERTVIVHGTDTMAITARFLRDRNVGSKTVILTGSMTPWAFKVTDAPDNLDLALYASMQMPSGVWIAGNGLVLHPNNAYKNYSTFRFESLDGTPSLLA